MCVSFILSVCLSVCLSMCSQPIVDVSSGSQGDNINKMNKIYSLVGTGGNKNHLCIQSGRCGGQVRIIVMHASPSARDCILELIFLPSQSIHPHLFQTSL